MPRWPASDDASMFMNLEAGPSVVYKAGKWWCSRANGSRKLQVRALA
jgi:hypothetical protein